MHKIFKYIGIASLMCFSFFVTEKTTMIAKNMDDIMIKIKDEYEKYELLSKNATINNDEIIPGICGKNINIEKSYNEMKKIGMYEDMLYQYEYVKPEKNIENIKDKYIVSGNNYKNYIYIFLELNEENKKYVTNVEFSNYNFIVTSQFYLDNLSIIKLLWENNNSILIQNTNFKEYKDISKKYKSLTNKNIYCYSKDKNEDFLSICSSNNSNTITMIDKISSQYLLNIKKNLSRGMFYNFILNDEYIKNKYIIENYINQRGIELSNIENTLKEC